MPKSPKRDDLMDEPEADRAELSFLLEESVESLSTTVAGWRTELARSAERAARLEESVAALSSAIESWQADNARSDASSDEKLERVLDILESGVGQSQAIAAEVSESLGNSATMLAKALEEWKAELRYGMGLTEVKLISAVEALGGQIGQMKSSIEEWNAAVTESGDRREARLIRALEALEGGIAKSLPVVTDIREQLGTSSVPISSALLSFRESMEAVLSRLTASVQEWHSQVGLSSANTEKRLLLSLEALETGIELTLAARQELEKKLIARLDDLESTRVVQDERSQRIETSLSELAGATEQWGAQAEEAAQSLVVSHELQNKMLLRLEELDIRIGRTEQEGEDRHDRLENILKAFTERFEAGQTELKALVDSFEGVATQESDPAVTGNLQQFGHKTLTRLEQLEGRLGEAQAEIQQRQERLEANLAALAHSIDDWRATGSEKAGRNRERIVRSLQALEAKIDTVGESRQVPASLRKDLAELTVALTHLRSSARQQTTVMRGLEELDLAMLRNRDDLARLAAALEARIDSLENRIDESVTARMTALENGIHERNKALTTLILGSLPQEGLGSLESLDAGKGEVGGGGRGRKRR